MDEVTEELNREHATKEEKKKSKRYSIYVCRETSEISVCVCACNAIR